MTSNVQPMPTRRRKPAPQRSHDEIYDLTAKADKAARDAVHRTDMLTEVVQRVELKLDEVVMAIGKESEDERGERVGTGVVGRLMRLESRVDGRFSLYDGWVKLAIGFGVAVTVLAPVVWWLVNGALARVLVK